MEDAKLQAFLGKRRPFLTAKRLLTNQIFRDIYGNLWDLIEHAPAA